METLALLPDDDIYYFLTTISNMALNRPKQDWLFIQTVTLQLFRVSTVLIFSFSTFLAIDLLLAVIFQIGFVNNSVRDKCMKSSRILIANLASKHPNLISDLLVALKKDFIFVGKVNLISIHILCNTFRKSYNCIFLSVFDVFVQRVASLVLATKPRR